MEIERIEIPPFELKWSEWVAWSDLERDARTNPATERLPDAPGVYEVKYRDSDERLTIGKASNLRMRVKQGLVKGKLPYPAGEKIRTKEDTSQIVVRWAETERRAAAEEELHLRFRTRFGNLPKHTFFT